MRAGEEEDEAVLPTASDEGHVDPGDSSLWCCSGDRLSLLLSSSKAYESSCFGNFPWFTEGETERGQRSECRELRQATLMINPLCYISLRWFGF